MWPYKCLGWRTSCTLPLICWEMSLGKADSTSLVLLSFLLSFPIFLNEYPFGIWCSYASFIQPVVEPSGEPIGRNIFSVKSLRCGSFFRMKIHLYNKKQIMFYITPGYWCVPGIRDDFYRYALWITPHLPTTSFNTRFTQHKKWKEINLLIAHQFQWKQRTIFKVKLKPVNDFNTRCCDGQSNQTSR